MLRFLGVLTGGPFTFYYILLDWFDTSHDSPIDGMLYYGSTLTDCSVLFLALTQSASTIQDQVRITTNGVVGADVDV